MWGTLLTAAALAEGSLGLLSSVAPLPRDGADPSCFWSLQLRKTSKSTHRWKGPQDSQGRHR